MNFQDPLPPFSLDDVPQRVTTARRYGGRLYLPGFGPKPCPVMVVSTCVDEDDLVESVSDPFRSGPELKVKPRVLRSAAGDMFKTAMNQAGIQQFFFTNLLKCLPDDKGARNNPPAELVAAFLPALKAEIEEVKPGIIICMGRPALDAVCKVPLSVSDIAGAWLWSEQYRAKVMYLPEIWRPLRKPEYLERWREDLQQVSIELKRSTGVAVEEIPKVFSVIGNEAQLREFVADCQRECRTLFAVDCEWGGRNHIDGRLRSIQFCWKPGHAVYVRFMDDAGNYAFDVPYRQAGTILAAWMDQAQVAYIGHQFAADAPWMSHVLGLKVFGKCALDTAFAQQCCDESTPMGLERLSIMYTTRGRYDMPLLFWKKENPQKEDAGYAFIPDNILVEYGCLDVDVTFQAAMALREELKRQKLETYFYRIFLPFVTDVFTEFALNGLPINRERLDELRALYQWGKRELELEFQKLVYAQATTLLEEELASMAAEQGGQPLTLDELARVIETGGVELGGTKLTGRLSALYRHWSTASSFNIRSGPQMQLWLFEVLGLTPVKSTARKEQGIPSIAWEKILTYPPERQKEFTPAVDKQTLKILSEQEPLIVTLLKLNAVGNVAKAFLKEAEVDDEGEVVRENGLHYWIASDGRIHGQMSTTETGRPRSWNPNSLNLPSYVNDSISEGLLDIIKRRHAAGTLPPEFERYLDPANKIPSLRSCISVENLPPLPGSKGWVMVESDYKTAELRGLAFKSGDENLIRILTEPDPQFVVAKTPGGPQNVRVRYDRNCGIPPEARDPRFLMAYMDKGTLKRIKVEDVMIGADGKPVHPDVDLHWSLAEMVFKKPRELLEKKRARDGVGKTGNFKTSYGATAATLERSIESDTGKKPDPGTGQAILDALTERQPVAQNWLVSLERVPTNPGYYRAESGRLRHFKVLDSDRFSNLRQRAIDGVLSAASREARNFPMQESVAFAAQRAGVRLMHAYRRQKLNAKLMAILYDSCVTICPIEERHVVAELHERYMATDNRMHDHGREWFYPIETEFNFAWSHRPSKSQQQELNQR